VRLQESAHRREIVVKDVIADAFLQQILLRPKEYSVIATLNLNGDYISDALAAQVGGIGMAPGANCRTASRCSRRRTARRRSTRQGHGQPELADPLRRDDAAAPGLDRGGDLVIKGVEGAISHKTVTYDLHRLMEGATKLSCSAFGAAVIANM